MNYMEYVKPELLALVPFLIGLGEVLKKWLFPEEVVVHSVSPAVDHGTAAMNERGFFWKIARRFVKTRKQIPYMIIFISVLLSSLWGLFESEYTGWRLINDAVIFTGIVQGATVGFMAMGVFDTFRSKKEE